MIRWRMTGCSESGTWMYQISMADAPSAERADAGAHRGVAAHEHELPFEGEVEPEVDRGHEWARRAHRGAMSDFRAGGPW